MTYPAPEQRVRAFLEHLTATHATVDFITGYGYDSLTVSDLRDVLNELDSYRTRVEHVEAHRADAVAAIEQLNEAAEGDSNDAEIEAGQQVRDILAAVLGIGTDYEKGQ